MKKFLSIFFLIAVSSNVFPMELEQSFDLRTGTEINTTLGVRFLNEARYELLANKRWQFSSGFLIAPGWSLLSAYHLDAGYNPLFRPELSAHIKFLNVVYHDISIGTAENSIIPYLDWKGKNFEADIGFSARFTNFDRNSLNYIFIYPNDLIQFHLYYRFAAYYNWNNPNIRLGLELKNSDWNYAGNSFEISWHIDAVYQLSSEWALKLNFGVTPSGFGGISVMYNRFVILAGAQYRI
ncbi:MAG: hypothetical protein OEV66_02830 [Spirochaetia bacterium]|nr:hypothetical protein [Spirochaetia bacterium]